MEYVILVHARDVREAIALRDRDHVATDVRFLGPAIGSGLVAIRTRDRLLRHRLAERASFTVFPPHFSSLPLTAEQAQLLGHGAAAGDTMETALLKADAQYDHYHFHPHSL